mmetsp:Transcript_76842/g.207307  ORF Transcript_76842/g.207307 Transcript_76842/m.207307 type:complete len:314 (+) Transcript_76842:4042-4983(+)
MIHQANVLKMSRRMLRRFMEPERVPRLQKLRRNEKRCFRQRLKKRPFGKERSRKNRNGLKRSGRRMSGLRKSKRKRANLPASRRKHKDWPRHRLIRRRRLMLTKLQLLVKRPRKLRPRQVEQQATTLQASKVLLNRSKRVMQALHRQRISPCPTFHLTSAQRLPVPAQRRSPSQLMVEGRRLRPGWAWVYAPCMNRRPRPPAERRSRLGLKCPDWWKADRRRRTGGSASATASKPSTARMCAKYPCGSWQSSWPAPQAPRSGLACRVHPRKVAPHTTWSCRGASRWLDDRRRALSEELVFLIWLFLHRQGRGP